MNRRPKRSTSVANHVEEPTNPDPKIGDKYGGGQWERWRLLYSGMKPYCGDVDTLHSSHVAAQYQVRAYNSHGWGHWSHVLTVDRGTTPSLNRSIFPRHHSHLLSVTIVDLSLWRPVCRLPYSHIHSPPRVFLPPQT